MTRSVIEESDPCFPALEMHSLPPDHLVGLVVKASVLRAEDPGFESPMRQDFSGVESYQ